MNSLIYTKARLLMANGNVPNVFILGAANLKKGNVPSVMKFLTVMKQLNSSLPSMMKYLNIQFITLHTFTPTLPNFRSQRYS